MNIKKTFKSSLVNNLLLFFLIFSSIILIHKFILTPVLVRGSSMEPTLQDRNRLFSFPWKKINRFDIVTLKAPDDDKKNYIKRVIGVPGDTIEYKQDKLIVNGHEMNEPYLDTFKKKLDANSLLTQDFNLNGKIPDNEYLVLGDNRTNSKDGRYFGLISSNSIEGVIVMRYWPLNKVRLF